MFEDSIRKLRASIDDANKNAYQKAIAINPNAPALPAGTFMGNGLFAPTNVIGLPYGMALTPEVRQQFKAYEDAGYILQYREPPNTGGGGFLGGISNAFASIDPSSSISRAVTSVTEPIVKPITETVGQNLAQLDKDLSLSQNAPLIAAIALSIAAPGVGSAIGQQMITAGLLPAATSAAVATAVGTGIANAALQVAQGKSPEEALKAGVIGAAGGAVGSYLVGDPGAINNFVSSTSTNLLAGKPPEEAIKSGIISSGAGLAGGTVAQGTGSAVAGQVAAGTTAGLLAGQTGEQALIRGVGNIKVDGLTSSIPPSTTAFDTTTDIPDNSGFDIPTATPQTPITGNTGGNMATYDDPTGGAGQYYGTEDDFYNQLYNYQGTPIDYATDPTGMMNNSNTQFYDDPTGGAGGMGTNQNPAMYGNLTVEQLRRLLSGTAGGAGARPLTTAQRTAQQQALGSLLGGAVGGVGGILAGETAAKAAEEQARMISQATGQAVGGSQFRPVGTTTRFGTSQFQVDPTTGQLTSAGYQLTPELKAMQDRVMALTGKGLTEAELAGDRYAPLTTGAQGLFGLGQQYLAQSPEQVAADYMAKQQDLLAPSRERQLAQLQTQLFNTGRGGLSVGGTGMRPGGGQGLRAASPEMEAYYNALAQQDAQLAAGAQQAGQQQVQFGAGLMGTGANLLGAYGQGLTGAYAPFSTGIGVGSSLEQLGQQPLSISQQLAQLSSASGARAGELGIRGTTAASVARLPSMQYNPLARALVGAGGNTQFGNALGQFTGNTLPDLLGLFSGGLPIDYGTDTRKDDKDANF